MKKLSWLKINEIQGEELDNMKIIYFHQLSRIITTLIKAHLCS